MHIFQLIQILSMNITQIKFTFLFAFKDFIQFVAIQYTDHLNISFDKIWLYPLIFLLILPQWFLRLLRKSKGILWKRVNFQKSIENRENSKYTSLKLDYYSPKWLFMHSPALQHRNPGDQWDRTIVLSTGDSYEGEQACGHLCASVVAA